jgi:hypothetical protein
MSRHRRAARAGGCSTSPSADHAELFHSFLGRTFRCAAVEFASVESNLAIANLDFHELADNVQHDGVFHGFDSGE